MRPREVLPWLLCIALAAGWVFTARPGLFAPIVGDLGPTPRERLLARWASTGFDSTALGRAWRAAGDTALARPAPVTLPLGERLYFGGGPVRAYGRTFALPRGRVLTLAVADSLVDGAALAELYTRRPDSSLALVQALDAGADTLRVTPEADATYVLRVEATPLARGSVTVHLGSAPRLGAFPVSGAGQRDVGSVWGDPRGGGRRRHEGIDIFHPRGTPLIAAAAGVVRRVRNAGRGGKQVWLELPGEGVSLYYAHLDSPYVARGQRLRPGDTLGTVGNTGNARTTPPHLHFGIYGRGGATDPLPWVSPAEAAGEPRGDFPPPERGDGYLVRTRVRTGAYAGAALANRTGTLPPARVVRALSTAGEATRVGFGGAVAWVRTGDLERGPTPTRWLAVSETTRLRDGETASASPVAEVAPGREVGVLGRGGSPTALYVEADGGVRGWIDAD